MIIKELTEDDHKVVQYDKEIVIDAIIGNGISREVSGWLAEVIDQINAYNNLTLAIDIPTGMLPDEIGYQKGSIVKADLTLTFHCPKRAFVFAENEQYCGDIIVFGYWIDGSFISIGNQFGICDSRRTRRDISHERYLLAQRHFRARSFDWRQLR